MLDRAPRRKDAFSTLSSASLMVFEELKRRIGRHCCLRCHSHDFPEWRGGRILNTVDYTPLEPHHFFCPYPSPLWITRYQRTLRNLLIQSAGVALDQEIATLATALMAKSQPALVFFAALSGTSSHWTPALASLNPITRQHLDCQLVGAGKSTDIRADFCVLLASLQIIA